MVYTYIKGGLAALFGAFVANLINFPLPWMLGPLLVTAALRISDFSIDCPPKTRNIGQWIIGSALGLYFTPQAFLLIFSNMGVIFSGMLFALILALVGVFVYCVFGKIGFTTAWFSSSIGGASEMTVLAERYGARADLVVTSHGIRLLFVILIIPFVFRFLGISGLDVAVPGVRYFDFNGFVVLFFATFIAGLVFQYFNIANAWVLGPMVAVIILMILGVGLSSLPDFLLKSGQLFIGWSLGNKYRRQFFEVPFSFFVSSFVFAIVAIVLSFLFGFLASPMTGIPLPTLVLGTTPGGISEMAITAKILNLGVPVVTVLHTTRMIFVVLVTGPIYKKLNAVFNFKNS